MSEQVSFRCQGCNAKLRTSIRSIGRSGSCPNCGHKTKVRPQSPSAEGPVLVLDDGYPDQRRQSAWTF